MAESDIARVVQVFESCHARWALVGAHAIGLLTEPRATADFDFVVEASKLRGVVEELTKEFGALDENDIGAAIQLKAIDVDLIRSNNHPLFQVALRESRAVGTWNVPRTEVLLVLKFMAAINPWRNQNKRRQDMADFGRVYQAAGGELDRAKMIELSKLVYPGADREFGELLGKIDRGEPITI